MCVPPEKAFPTEANLKNGVTTTVSVRYYDAAGKALGDASTTIPVGGSAEYVATIHGGKGLSLYVLWQPHPELEFKPFEKDQPGPQTSTIVTFKEPGTYRIWAQLLENRPDRVRVTLDESDHIEVTVPEPDTVAPPPVKPAGIGRVWKYGDSGATLTITPEGDGKYKVVQQGVGNATGTATVTADGFRIECKSPDGSVTRRCTVTLDAGGRSGIAKWQDSTGTSGTERVTLVASGWPMTADGYPDIAGEWTQSTGYTVKVAQSAGGKATATCSYTLGGTTIRCTMTGTISRSGRFVSTLQHTEGVAATASGYRQNRDMQLSADGRSFSGKATYTGGEHAVRWTRKGEPGTVPTPPGDGLTSLAGNWTAYVKGTVAAQCSIVQKGRDLTFIIHRTPEVRSSGRFLDAATIVADGWGHQKGTIREGGRRIDWADSWWGRKGGAVPGAVPPAPDSGTGRPAGATPAPESTTPGSPAPGPPEAGWARRTVRNVTLDLPADWKGKPSETDQTGTVAPAHNTWYTSARSADGSFTVEFQEVIDVDSAQGRQAVLGKKDIKVGGRAATWYDLTGEEGGAKLRAVFVTPEPRRRPVFAGAPARAPAAASSPTSPAPADAARPGSCPA